MPFKTKKQAEYAGRKALKQIGNGWNLRVWENLGWHFELQNNPITVSESNGEFTCLITDDLGLEGCGSITWSDGYGEYFKNPRDAVIHATSIAREVVNDLNIIVQLAEKSLCKNTFDKVVRIGSRIKTSKGCRFRGNNWTAKVLRFIEYNGQEAVRVMKNNGQTVTCLLKNVYVV